MTLLPVVGVAAVAYWAGLRSLWRGAPGRGVSRWRAAGFGAGLLAIVVALASPLDAAAEEVLSAHMIQHLLLVIGAAPLLVLGRPGLVALAGLPPRSRRRLHGLAAARPVRTGLLVLTTPTVAWLLHISAMWTWHIPPAYQAALQHRPVHWLEHATLLGTAVLFWAVALEPGSGRRLVRGADVAYMLSAWLAGGALGALFTFATEPIYSAYVLTAAAGGVDPLRDQQAAGLIMWIPGGLVYLGAAGAMFLAWLRRVEADQRRAEAQGAREVVRA